MAEESADLVMEILRQIQADLAKLKDGQRAAITRLDATLARLAAIEEGRRAIPR